jgi:transcriptional regulator with XRE-family HTH domain
MTPFGEALRTMRAERGIRQKEMAGAIGVSAAYLSALEHGHRGRPSWEFVQKVIGYFNIIWDEAEELQRLAQLSDPNIRIDTAGLSVEKTELANRLARLLPEMAEKDVERLRAFVDKIEK